MLTEWGSCFPCHPPTHTTLTDGNSRLKGKRMTRKTEKMKVSPATHRQVINLPGEGGARLGGRGGAVEVYRLAHSVDGRLRLRPHQDFHFPRRDWHVTRMRKIYFDCSKASDDKFSVLPITFTCSKVFTWHLWNLIENSYITRRFNRPIKLSTKQSHNIFLAVF